MSGPEGDSMMRKSGPGWGLAEELRAKAFTLLSKWYLKNKPNKRMGDGLTPVEESRTDE